MNKYHCNITSSTQHEEDDDEQQLPVSPTAHYFNSSVLSVVILAVLEFEIPIDDSKTLTLLKHVFLPINPRFSSLMVKDGEGLKQWKKVDVKLKDHINVPIFPQGKSPEFYNECLNDYLSKIAMEALPQNKPLWDIHIIKYPTSNAGGGSVVFKLHHALGDGYSLMGALLSCLQRADDSSLPLTFPTCQLSTRQSLSDRKPDHVFGNVTKICSSLVNTASDFVWSILKSRFLQDDRTPIRSGDEGVEFRPIDLITMAFSLDQIKQIKVNLGVTINDVITGLLFLGTRLYMERTSQKSKKSESTALILFNTRHIRGYKSVAEMTNAHDSADKLWGNRFAFLHISIPKLNHTNYSNPLEFVYEAQKNIMRQRNSAAVYLNSKLLETVTKFKGPEASAQYIYSTLKNSSMTISNMIGPVERMALANHPIKGIYFTVVGVPQSLTVTVVSYMNELRVAAPMEKGFMDPVQFKTCVESAFDLIFKAAVVP